MRLVGTTKTTIAGDPRPHPLERPEPAADGPGDARPVLADRPRSRSAPRRQGEAGRRRGAGRDAAAGLRDHDPAARAGAGRGPQARASRPTSMRCSPSSSGSAAPRASNHRSRRVPPSWRVTERAVPTRETRTLVTARAAFRQATTSGLLAGPRPRQIAERSVGIDRRKAPDTAIGGQHDLIVVALRRAALLVAGRADDTHAARSCQAGRADRPRRAAPAGPDRPCRPLHRVSLAADRTPPGRRQEAYRSRIATPAEFP